MQARQTWVSQNPTAVRLSCFCPSVKGIKLCFRYWRRAVDNYKRTTHLPLVGAQTPPTKRPSSSRTPTTTKDRHYSPSLDCRNCIDLPLPKKSCFPKFVSIKEPDPRTPAPKPRHTYLLFATNFKPTGSLLPTSALNLPPFIRYLILRPFVTRSSSTTLSPPAYSEASSLIPF